MDPYLEDPVLWPDVHHGLISFLKIALVAVLPRRYAVHIGERLYVVNPRQSLFPDVIVVERPRPRGPRAAGVGATATLESDPPYVIYEEPLQIRESFIDLVRRGDPSQVVTTIEVLSPSNKDRGNPGHGLYRKKQRQILESTTHLVEIDLLRQGEHTVAVAREMLDAGGNWDYVVSLHRAGHGRCFETWPVPLRRRLPRFCVPLVGKDRDVVVDLQRVLQRCYDQFDYASEIDYRLDPVVPLREDDAEWANLLLQKKGRRPKKRPKKKP
jgi:hypothetical protein